MALEETYKIMVRELAMRARNGESNLFLNSDEEHALEVLVNIFKEAKSVVRIFAGDLCGHVGCEKEYIIALSDFIDRGGEVRILLNKFKNELVEKSALFKRLAYYQSEGKPVLVKSTDARPYRTTDDRKEEVHFTIGDEKSYRLEIDTEERTAICDFCDEKTASGLAVFFDGIFDREQSETIDLEKLV